MNDVAACRRQPMGENDRPAVATAVLDRQGDAARFDRADRGLGRSGFGCLRCVRLDGGSWYRLDLGLVGLEGVIVQIGTTAQDCGSRLAQISILVRTRAITSSVNSVVVA